MDSRLEVSVSFGRFENDVLSWEKWSSFSPNKYLEEVGSLSTPGSVAQKKAYFEAHYKKIAAQKAEILEQEKQNGSHFDGDSSEIYSNGADADAAAAADDEVVDEVSVEESCLSVLPYEDIVGKLDDDDDDDDNEVISFQVAETGAFEIDSVSEEVGNNIMPEESDARRDIESEAADASRKNDPVVLKKPVIKKANSNTGGNGVAVQKANPTKKMDVTKKQFASPPSVRKPPPPSISSPRNVKPAPKSATPPQPSKKKPMNGSPILPLHSSLDSGSVKPSGSSSMTAGKSLIMEKMGDKEIVRRAFRSFRKRDDDASSSSSNVIRFQQEEASTKKVSISRTPLMKASADHEREKRMTARRSSSETRSTPLPSSSSGSSRKKSGLEKSYATSFSPRMLTISGDKSDKRRENFPKKLEAENAKQKH